MHGGGFQSTEWFDTPDGRPGWAERSIEAGYTVLAVDRPGHVRSLLHTAIMGGMSPPSPMSMDTISTFWKRDVQSRRSGTWPETAIRRWPALSPVMARCWSISPVPKIWMAIAPPRPWTKIGTTPQLSYLVKFGTIEAPRRLSLSN
jgi:pimeloyl-ACP methyl ester carboxylesterase